MILPAVVNFGEARTILAAFRDRELMVFFERFGGPSSVRAKRAGARRENAKAPGRQITTANVPACVHAVPADTIIGEFGMASDFLILAADFAHFEQQVEFLNP